MRLECKLVSGYEKKKTKLLAPFLQPAANPTPSAPPPDQARNGGGGGGGVSAGGGGGGGGDGEASRGEASEDGGGTTDSTRVSDSSGLNISVAGEPTDTRSASSNLIHAGHDRTRLYCFIATNLIIIHADNFYICHFLSPFSPLFASIYQLFATFCQLLSL